MNKPSLRQSFSKDISPDTAFDSKDNAELISIVLSALKRRKAESNTIEMICTHTGWSWQIATSCLKFVQTKYKEELARTQVSWVSPYGIGTSIIGFIQLWLSVSSYVWAWGKFWWWEGLQFFVKLPNSIACPICLDVQPFYTSLAQYNQFFPYNETPDTLVLFYFIYCAPIIGFGMVVGGLVGIIRAWDDFMKSKRPKS